MATATTTELEAVNIMLSSIGEAPVNSLSSGLVDAELAQTTLHNVSREVQAAGWSFNTEYNRSYALDGAGELLLGNDVLKADMCATRTESFDLVQRGTKMYNRAEGTYILTDGPIKLDVVVFLDYTLLPEAARRYITIRAARIFQDRTIGSQELHGFQLRDEQMALVELRDSDAENADHSIFDNYSVGSVIDRLGGKVI